jgi:hypothetical protein
MDPAAKQQKLDAYNKKTGKSAKADQPTAGPGSLSSAAEAKVIERINKVYGLLSNPTTTTLDANKNEVIRPSTAKDVLARLRAQGVDPRILNVARSLLHNKGKGVGEMGLKNAHDLGIHVSPHWKVVRKTRAEGAPPKFKPTQGA